MAAHATGKATTLEEMLLHIEQLEERVAALERINGVVQPEPVHPPVRESIAEPVRMTGSSFAIVAKALLGFAGAYLLRAVAESGYAPQWVGVLAGLVYASAWLGGSARTYVERNAGSAIYSLTSALIFAGLVWENSVEKHVAPAGLAAALVALFTLAAVALSRRVALPAIASAVTSVTTVLGLALLVGTHDVVPFTIALLVVAAGMEIARPPRMRILAALAADLAVAIVTWVITRPQGVPESYPPFGITAVVSLQIALVLIYAISKSRRTLVLGEEITRFEIGQSAIGISLLIWGAASLGGETSVARTVAQAFCLLAGIACYALAVLLLAHRDRKRNFLAYGIFGLALVMVAVSMMFSGPALIIAWCLLAAVVSWLGTHEHRVSLQLHASAYLLAAATGSGLLEFARRALHGTTTPESSQLAIIGIVTAALVGCYLLSGNDTAGRTRIAPALIAALALWSLLGLGGATITALLGADSMISSTLRTGLICLFALAMARSDARRVELAWLVYPLMLYGAYRLITEDFPHGRPTALALSLLFYGGTLLLLTRMVRVERVS